MANNYEYSPIGEGGLYQYTPPNYSLDSRGLPELTEEELSQGLPELTDEELSSVNTTPKSPVLDPIFSYKGIPEPPTILGELGKGVATGYHQLGEMGYGVAGLAATAVEKITADSLMEPGMLIPSVTSPVKDWAIRGLAEEKQHMEPYTAAVSRIEDVGGAGDFLNYAAFGIGTLVPMLVGTGGTGGIGAFFGKKLGTSVLKGLAEGTIAREAAGLSEKAAADVMLKSFGREASEKYIADKTAGLAVKETIEKGVAKALVNKYLERGAIMGGFTGSMYMEAGSIAADQYETNKEFDPLRAAITAPFAAALDIFPEWLILKKLGLFGGGGFAGGILKRMGKSAALGVAMEAPTEATQTLIERIGVRGKDLTSAEAYSDYLNSGIIGGLGGGFFSGLGGAASRRTDAKRKKGEPEAVPTVPGSGGFPSSVADIQAAIAASGGDFKTMFQEQYLSPDVNMITAFHAFTSAPIDADTAAEQQKFQARLDAFVADGKITPELAATILGEAISIVDQRKKVVAALHKAAPPVDMYGARDEQAAIPTQDLRPTRESFASKEEYNAAVTEWKSKNNILDDKGNVIKFTRKSPIPSTRPPTPEEIEAEGTLPIMPGTITPTESMGIGSLLQGAIPDSAAAARQHADRNAIRKDMQDAESFIKANHPDHDLDNMNDSQLEELLGPQGLGGRLETISRSAVMYNTDRSKVIDGFLIKANKLLKAKRAEAVANAEKVATTAAKDAAKAEAEAKKQSARDVKAAQILAKQKLKADKKAAKDAAKAAGAVVAPVVATTPAPAPAKTTTKAATKTAATPAPATPTVTAAAATPTASRIYRTGFEAEGTLPSKKENTLRTVIHGVLPDGTQAQLNIISDLKGAVRSVNITKIDAATGRADTVNKHLDQKVKGQYTLSDKGVAKITDKLKDVFTVKAWPEEWKQFAKTAAAPEVKLTATGGVKKPPLAKLQKELAAKTEALKTAEKDGYAKWQKDNPGKVMSAKKKANIYKTWVTDVQARIEVIKGQIAEYEAEKGVKAEETVTAKTKAEAAPVAAEVTAKVTPTEVIKKSKLTLQERLSNWQVQLATAQAILADPEAHGIAKHGQEKWGQKSAKKKANSIAATIDTYTKSVAVATKHIAELQAEISGETAPVKTVAAKPVKVKAPAKAAAKVTPKVEVVVPNPDLPASPEAITALAQRISEGKDAVTPDELNIKIKHGDALHAELVRLQEANTAATLAALGKPPDVSGAAKAAAESTANVISAIWNETINGIKRGGLSMSGGAIFDDVWFEKMKPVIASMWNDYVALGQTVIDWISYAVKNLVAGGYEHGAATAYIERWTAEQNESTQASDKLIALAKTLRDNTTGRIARDTIFGYEDAVAAEPVTVAQAVQSGVPNASQYTPAQLTRINRMLDYISNPFRLLPTRGVDVSKTTPGRAKGLPASPSKLYRKVMGVTIYDNPNSEASLKDATEKFFDYADMVKQVRSGLQSTGGGVWSLSEGRYVLPGVSSAYITSEQWARGMQLPRQSLALENKVSPVYNSVTKKWEHAQDFNLLTKQVVTKSEAQILEESGSPVTASNELMDWILSRAIAKVSPAPASVPRETTVKQIKASVTPDNIISKEYKTDSQISDHILAAQKLGVDVTHIMSYLFDSGNLGDNLRSLRPASWEELKAARLKAAPGHIALAHKNSARAQMTRFYEPSGTHLPLAAMVIGAGGIPKLISTDSQGNEVINTFPMEMLTNDNGKFVINENHIASDVTDAFSKFRGFAVTEDTRLEIIKLVPGLEPVAMGNYADYLAERIAKLELIYIEAKTTGKDQAVEVAPTFGLNAAGKPNVRPRRANFASSEQYDAAVSEYHADNMLQAYLTSHGDPAALHKVTLSEEEIGSEIGMLKAKQTMTSAVVIPDIKILSKAIDQVEYIKQHAGEGVITSAIISDISRELQKSQDEIARRTLIISQSKSSTIAQNSSISTLNAKNNKLFVRASETYIDPEAAREFVVAVDKEDTVLDPKSNQYKLIDAQVKQSLGRSLKSIVDMFKSEGIEVPIGAKYTLYYKALIRDEDPALVLQEGNVDRVMLGKVAEEMAADTLINVIRKNKDIKEAFKIFLAGKRDKDGLNLLGTKKGTPNLFVYLDYKVTLSNIIKMKSSFELEKIAAGMDVLSLSSEAEREAVLRQMAEVGAELDMIELWIGSREQVKKKASYKYLKEIYSGGSKEKSELRIRLKEFLEGGYKKYNMEAVEIAKEVDAEAALFRSHHEALVGSFNNTLKYMDEDMLGRVKQKIIDSNYEMKNLALTVNMMRTLLDDARQIAAIEINETRTARGIPRITSGQKAKLMGVSQTEALETWLATMAVNWDGRIKGAAEAKGGIVSGDVVAENIAELNARDEFTRDVSTAEESVIPRMPEDDFSAPGEPRDRTGVDTARKNASLLYEHNEAVRSVNIGPKNMAALEAQAKRDLARNRAELNKNKITRGENRTVAVEEGIDNFGDSVDENDPSFNMSAMDSKAEAVYSAKSPTSATGLWHGLIEMFGDVWRKAKDLANRLWFRLMARKKFANNQMVSTDEWNSLRMPGTKDDERISLPGIRDPRFKSTDQMAVIAAGRKLWGEIKSNIIPLQKSFLSKEKAIQEKIADVGRRMDDQAARDKLYPVQVLPPSKHDYLSPLEKERAGLSRDLQNIQAILYSLSGLHMFDLRFTEKMDTGEGNKVKIRTTTRFDSVGTKSKKGQKWGKVFADNLGPANPFFKGLNSTHLSAIFAMLRYSNIPMGAIWEDVLVGEVTRFRSEQKLTAKERRNRQNAYVEMRNGIWGTAAPWHMTDEMLTIRAQQLADAELARNIDSAVNVSIPFTKNWNMRLTKYSKNAEGKVTDKMVVFERHLTPAARAHINSLGYKFDLFDVIKNPADYPDHGVKYTVAIDKGDRSRYLVTLPNGRVIHLQSMRNPATGLLAYHILEDQTTIRNADTVKFYEEIRTAEEVVEQTEQARIKAAKVSLMETIQSTRPELTGPGINLSMLQDNIPNAVVTQLSRDSYQIEFPSYSLRVDGNLSLEAVLRPKKGGRSGEMEWVAVNGTAFGRWTASKGLLQLAKLNELDVTSALHHELFHMVAEIFMTAEEQAMFLRQYRKPGEKTDVAAWERAADAYLSWNQSTPNTTWERFLGWARRILYDFKSTIFKGVDPAISTDAFFRDLRDGKIYSRTPQFNTLNPGVYKSGSLAHAYNMSTMPAQSAMEWAKEGKMRGWLTDRAYSAISAATGRNSSEIHLDRNVFEQTLDWTREGGLEKEYGIPHQPSRIENALSNLLYLADNYPKSWGRVLKVVRDFTHKFEAFRFKYIAEDTKISHELKHNERLLMDPLIIATNVVKRPNKDYFTEAQLRDPAFIRSMFTHSQVQSKITTYNLPENIIKSYLELVETMKSMWVKMYDHAVFASLKPYQYSLLPKEFAELKEAYSALIKRGDRKPLSKEQLDEIFSQHIRHVVAKKEIDPVTGKEKITKIVKSNPLKNAYKNLSSNYNEIAKYRQDIGHLPAYFPITHGVGSHYVAVMQNLPDGKGKGGMIRQAIHSYSAKSLAHAHTIRNILLKDTVLSSQGILPADIRVLPTVKPEDAQYFLASEINMLRLVELAKYEIQKDPDNRMSPEQSKLFSDNIVKAIIDMKHTRTGGGTVLQRKLLDYEDQEVIKGYIKEDQIKIIDGYVLGWHGMMNKLDKSMEFLNIMKDVKIKQPILYNDIAEYVQHDLRNTDKWDTVAGNIKTTAAFWMLGGKLATIPMQLSQNLTMTIPQMAVELMKLGSKESIIAAEKYVFGAMKHIAFDPLLQNTKNFAPDELVFMNYMKVRGDFMAQQLADFERNASANIPKFLKTIFHYAMWPMRAFESYNRKVAALAIYRMLKKNSKLTDEQMYEKAESFVLHTQVFYGPQNYPLIARGGTMTAKVAGVAWTFKPFPHSYILNAIQNFRTGGSAIDPVTGERVDTASAKAGMVYLGRSLAYIAVMGGIAALPFFDDLLEWLEKKYATPFRSQARAKIRSMIGSHGERFYQAGLAGLIFGADISGAIRPIERPDTFNELVLGVYGGLYEKAVKTAQAGAAGEYIRAMEHFAPTAAESIFKGIRLGMGEGMTTVAGRPVMGMDDKQFRLNPAETLLQVGGIKSYPYGTIQQQRRTLQVILEGANERAKSIREQINRAGTPMESMAAEKRRREYNDAIPLNMRKIISEIQPYRPTTIDRKQTLFLDRFGSPVKE
jgi:hypothetical protein